MFKKKLVSIILTAVIVATTIFAGAAVSFAGTSASDLYMKQIGRGKCTLASATMMVRSKMYYEGNSSWPNVTQESMLSTAWINGAGLRHSFSYAGVTVTYAANSSVTCNTSEALISLLQQHPEGIEIYIRDLPHAVFLTRYDASSGIFYVADPVYGYEQPLTESWMRKVSGGSSQENIIKTIDAIWYVSSYTEQTASGGLVGEVRSASTDNGTIYEPSVEPVEPVEPVSVSFEKVNDYSNASFTDVDLSAWYAAYVQAAYETGLMTGTSETEFSTEGNVTIIQAIVMADRIHSIYYGDGATFEASEGEIWYQPYVDYAVENGIITSKYDQSVNVTLNYDQDALRVQFAEILSGSLPTEALSAINSSSDLFNDYSSDTNAERYHAVYALYRAGIMTGDDEGNFKPWTPITRAEVSAVVSRMGESELRIQN